MRKLPLIRKLAFLFAGIFLFVYSLDYVPGIMAENGKMFGLFGMTPIVDLGHLTLGALALISGFISSKVCRIYFWALFLWYGLDVILYFTSHFSSMSLLTNVAINMPHLIGSLAGLYIALNVDKTDAASAHS
jgi:hypothetical protein